MRMESIRKMWSVALQPGNSNIFCPSASWMRITSSVVKVVLIISLCVMDNNLRAVHGTPARGPDSAGNRSAWVALDEADLEVLSDEKRLVQDLLQRYSIVGTTGRPVRNTSTPVKVHFGLGLIKMNVEEKDNMLSMSAWTRYRWTDEYLRWNPENYGDIQSVKLPQTKIWTPDIMLYNTGNTDKFEREALAVVGADGTVSWFPQRIYHSSCSIDVKMFPFDNQTCHMWFGSWTHSVLELDLQLAFSEGIDLSTFMSDFRDSSKWHIEKVVATRITSDGNGPHFAVLSFQLYLQRRMIFSSYILTFPVVFLSFLTLLVFWLPAGSTDKSGLGLTIFGSLLLLLLILVEAAPPTASGVPLLGVYYCFNIVIVIMSIFLSSLVAKIGAAQKMGIQRKVPRLAKLIFFRWFATVLCLRSHDPKRHQHHPTQHPHPHHQKNHHHHHPKHHHPDTTTQEDGGGSFTDPLHRQRPSTETSTSLSLDDYSRAMHKMEALYACSAESDLCEQISRQLGELVELLQFYVKGRSRLEELQKKQTALDEEWAFLAEILDKIFFMLYIVVIVCSLVFFFPRK